MQLHHLVWGTLDHRLHKRGRLTQRCDVDRPLVRVATRGPHHVRIPVASDQADDGVPRVGNGGIRVGVGHPTGPTPRGMRPVQDEGEFRHGEGISGGIIATGYKGIPHLVDTAALVQWGTFIF